MTTRRDGSARDSDALATLTGWPLEECPRCHLRSDGRPFCPRDGTIFVDRPFEVGDRYEASELLGAGGFGFVFAGRHRMLGKPVAIKVLRPDVAADATQAQRFLREARTASQLAHENIVSILDVGHDPSLDLLYLVMERLRGESLAQVLRRDGSLAPSRAIPILVQLARALGAAHTVGVIHRDLNPRNVLLVETSGRSDVVKLCDFGLSRLASGADRVTGTGAVLGTPAYMAPEQIRGEPDQDPRVDVYAFGVTAYELLSGSLPFDAPTPVALLASKLQARNVTPLRERVAGISAELDELVARCLALEPADRPDDMRAIEATLVALASGGDAETQPTGDLVGQMVGSYRIERLIGVGGLGSVYQAVHPLIGTRVAVKVLLPEVSTSTVMVERFVQEARASGQIGSPHIPRYTDFGRLPSGQPFAVMELLEGQSLADRLARNGLPELAEVADIIAQVARAIAQAHAAGIIHRDIKPDNLFLCRGLDGALLVKVLDFGIAKLLTPTGAGARTAVGIMLGTPYYCAPEQALGLDVGPAADVYGLGATAFEMLTGRPPFDGEQTTQVLGKKTTTDAPRVRSLRPELPEDVDRTIARMLERDPEARLSSMNAVAAAVESWIRRPRLLESAIVAPLAVEPFVSEPHDLDDAPSQRSRSRGWYAVVALAVVAAGVALYIGVASDRDASPRSTSPPPAPAIEPSPPQASGAGNTIVVPIEPAHDEVPPPPVQVAPQPERVVPPPERVAPDRTRREKPTVRTRPAEVTHDTTPAAKPDLTPPRPPPTPPPPAAPPTRRDPPRRDTPRDDAIIVDPWRFGESKR